MTDTEGRTKRVVTDSPQAVQEVTLQPKALEGCCSVHAENAEDAGTPITFKPQGVATNPTDVGSSVKRVPTPKGEARSLTYGEIVMARKVYGSSIDYSKVKVHNGEYLWFGLQPENTAMTPNGEMYFNPKYFLEDYSDADIFMNHWFIHEMIHVWQHQLGYGVKLRGAIRVGLGYEYVLSADKKLSDYNMEAQGQIVADYYALKYAGRLEIFSQKYPDPVYSQDDLPLYEKVLSKFIANPSDKTSLP